MAAFPKYHELICDTYTPVFTASSAPCVLPSHTQVTKSRLQAGGTFFRSVKDGGDADVNQIKLQCAVLMIDNTDGIITETVDFTITDPDNVVTVIPTFTQVLDTNGSPDTCPSNGFDQLRTALSSNSDIDMSPNDDYIGSNPSAGSGWVLADEAYCRLTSFGPTNMTGASVIPSGSGAIRTGPAYTLYHVVAAETGSTGEITDVNAISEWDGEKWIGHPSTLYMPAFDADGNVITPHPDCPNPLALP